jgi:citrate lyase subunit beta-like protein
MIMKRRRALLYTPATDLHKIEKATTLGVDCICLDLEDSVTLERKPVARTNAMRCLQNLDFGSSEKLVRINGLGSGMAQEDLAAVLPGLPDGIVLPKIRSVGELHEVDALLAIHEQAHGLPVNSVTLITIIESARMFVDLPRLAEAPSRLQALIFGAEDLALDIGATRTRMNSEMFFARSTLILHAAAFGLQSIDMVTVDFRNPEALHIEAFQGAQMGFTGKQVIHPAQVAPVQEAFTPSPEQVEWAQRVLSAYEEHMAQGQGAFELEGRMIDAPVIRAARRTLDRAA